MAFGRSCATCLVVARQALSMGMLCVLCAVTDAGAQAAPHSGYRMADTGSRVRVAVTDSILRSPLARLPVRQIRGTITQVASDTLFLRADNEGPIAIPRAHIAAVAISLGPPSRWASAQELGGYGAVILALVLQAKAIDPERERFQSGWHAAAVGAGIGFSAGALIGLVSPYERWRAALLPE